MNCKKYYILIASFVVTFFLITMFPITQIEAKESDNYDTQQYQKDLKVLERQHNDELKTLFVKNFINAGNLNEKSVNELITLMNKVINNMNADGVARAMSPDIEVVMHITANGQEQTMKVNKEQYIDMLKESWGMITNDNYKTEDVKIDISKDRNSANVKSTIKESMTVQGQNIKSTSKEELVIKLIDGKLVITEVTGWVSIYYT